jgi:ribonuclease T1
MLKNYSQLLLGLIIGLLAGFFIAKQYIAQPVVTPPQQVTTNNNTKPTNPTVTTPQQEREPSNAVPQKALDVLQYIKQNGKAMPGYVGGRVFSNREKLLPQTDDNGNNMQYNEWDVNPKVEGQNRGTQRLVTSRSGRAWYTGNHYKSFTEIK